MESFEYRAITTAVNAPRIWKRYLDDTFVMQQQSNREFLQQINSVDPSIIFTAEETRPDGSMPFLDTLITPQIDGILTTSVYRKLIYIYSGTTITIWHANTVWSTPNTWGQSSVFQPQLLKEEPQHFEEVLMKCKYPRWAINKVLLNKKIQ